MCLMHNVHNYKQKTSIWKNNCSKQAQAQLQETREQIL